MDHPGRMVVFGASGFVGGTITRYLSSAQSAPVVGYSSRDFDLCDPQQALAAAESLRSDDAVVYCAAITRRVEESWEAMGKNALMVRNLLSGLKPGGIRSLLALSTVDVYGLPPAELPITENTPTSPDGYYSLSMSTCESLFSIDGPTGVPLTVLRLPGTYGPGDRHISIISRFIDMVRLGAPIRLENGGSALRDFLWEDDLARIVTHFIENPSSTKVNAVTGQSISIKELVNVIGQILVVPPVIEDVPAGCRSGDFEFDNTHLKLLMPSFEPTSIETGIEALVNT